VNAFGEIFKAIGKWPARYFVAFGLVAAALLFLAGSPWSTRAGFDGAPQWTLLALTITSLACTAVAAVKLLEVGVEQRRRRKAASRQSEAFESRMRNLKPDERAVLAKFVEDNTATATFAIGDRGAGLGATAQSLALRGYLMQVSRSQNAWFLELTYVIQDSVFEYLKAHPEMIVRASEEEGSSD